MESLRFQTTFDKDYLGGGGGGVFCLGFLLVVFGGFLGGVCWVKVEQRKTVPRFPIPTGAVVGGFGVLSNLHWKK